MLKVSGAVIACVLTLAAQAEPADQVSVERLLALSKAGATIESSVANLEAVMRQAMQQVTAAQKLTAKQRKIIDELPPKFAAAMRTELSWDKLRPEFVRIYQETFNQDEVDGLIAFCQTSVGRALVDKSPVLTAKSVAIVQPLMQTLLPKIQAAVQETMAEAKRVK